MASPAKEIREFDGRTYVLERAIRTDFALVHARYGDRHGNLVYEESAQNFNPLCARGRADHRSPRSKSSSSPASSIRRGCTRRGSSSSASCTSPDVDKRIEKRTVSS